MVNKHPVLLKLSGKNQGICFTKLSGNPAFDSFIWPSFARIRQVLLKSKSLCYILKTNDLCWGVPVFTGFQS